jgi:hypothetical protein
MSHITEMDLVIEDEGCLRAAALEIGLEVREKKTYRWFGRYVGDSTLPEGIDVGQLGTCEFALGIPGDDKAYEVGVVKRRDGQGYTLLYDYWGPGRKIEEVLGGRSGDRIRQEYAVQVGIKDFKRQGLRVSRHVNEATGEVMIKARAR